MKFNATMKWVEARNQWDIIKENGFTMYHIPACENIDIIFEQPSKEKDEMFTINIQRHRKKE